MDTRLNRAGRAKGVRNVAYRVRVRLSRKLMRMKTHQTSCKRWSPPSKIYRPFMWTRTNADGPIKLYNCLGWGRGGGETRPLVSFGASRFPEAPILILAGGALFLVL